MANFDPAFDKMIRNEGGLKLTNIEGRPTPASPSPASCLLTPED